jgi:hypothetical protein
MTDKERQEEGEIYITEQQTHYGRDHDLHSRPKIDKPPFGKEG